MSAPGIPWQELLTACALFLAGAYLTIRAYRASRRGGGGAGCQACPANTARRTPGGGARPCARAHAPPSS